MLRFPLRVADQVFVFFTPEHDHVVGVEVKPVFFGKIGEIINTHLCAYRFTRVKAFIEVAFAGFWEENFSGTRGY